MVSLGDEDDVSGGGEEGLVLSRLLSLTRHHNNLELLLSRWSYKSHTFVAACGEFSASLEESGEVNDAIHV